MIDLNDFQPIGDQSSNPQNNIQSPISESSSIGLNNMNNIFINQNNSQVDEEEQKRILDRQKEAEERKAKINKKIEEEEKKRNEIRQKASGYLVEFEAKRQEQITKRKKILEEKQLNQNKTENPQGNSEMWNKVSGNFDLKESEYKGTKDVKRMREAMMNRQNDPKSEELKNFFG